MHLKLLLKAASCRRTQERDIDRSIPMQLELCASLLETITDDQVYYLTLSEGAQRATGWQNSISKNEGGGHDAGLSSWVAIPTFSPPLTSGIHGLLVRAVAMPLLKSPFLARKACRADEVMGLQFCVNSAADALQKQQGVTCDSCFDCSQ
jgi:hypothetical protein